VLLVAKARFLKHSSLVEDQLLVNGRGGDGGGVRDGRRNDLDLVYERRALVVNLDIRLIWAIVDLLMKNLYVLCHGLLVVVAEEDLVAEEAEHHVSCYQIAR
jgi:hypothetical protein